MSEIFDKEQALEQAGGDPALAKDLLQMLFAELPDLLEELKKALADNNKSAIWDHTHKIHGSTAYCGVPALRAAAHSMEQLIRDEMEAEFSAGVEIIEREIDRLIGEGDAILAQLD